MVFNFIKRKIGFWRQLKKIGEINSPRVKNEHSIDEHITNDLYYNVKNMQNSLNNSSDLKEHKFRIGPDKNEYECRLVYIDGFIDNNAISNFILRPLLAWNPGPDRLPDAKELIKVLAQEVLYSGDVQIAQNIADLVEGCLGGNVCILIEGCTSGLMVSVKGWEKRSITEPQSEVVVRGPREGFTENLRTNTTMIRRKIRSGQLCVKELTLGRKTATSISLMYLKGVADPKIVAEVEQRIENLDVDSILESGYIEEYIEDAPFSVFATIGYSEKPDVVAGRLLEGRVAILVDGTPFVLTAPMLFVESFQTAEDYYTRPLYASLMRIFRFIAFALAVFTPAIYIALTSFQQEMIPTILLLTIANARESTPFPTVVEAFIMVFAFEILREAGIRLPRPVGQAISIVGALIIGDAAVAAGIVGASMVIAIAITAVAGFLVPSQNESIAILRLLMMVMAGILGFYGMAMGTLAIMLHVASLTSFGVPYYGNFFCQKNWQDSLVRIPLWAMVKRPVEIAEGDITRHKIFIPPLRPYADPETDEDDEDVLPGRRTGK